MWFKPQPVWQRRIGFRSRQMPHLSHLWIPTQGCLLSGFTGALLRRENPTISLSVMANHCPRNFMIRSRKTRHNPCLPVSQCHKVFTITPSSLAYCFPVFLKSILRLAICWPIVAGVSDDEMATPLVSLPVGLPSRTLRLHRLSADILLW